MAKDDERGKVYQIELDVLREELQKHAISPDTPVPMKITPRQMYSAAAFLGGSLMIILGTACTGVWWLSQREHHVVEQIKDVQADTSEKMLEMQIDFQSQIVALRRDMNGLLATIGKENNVEFNKLKAEVLELKSSMPPEFPPPNWVRDVFKPLVERVRELEKRG